MSTIPPTTTALAEAKDRVAEAVDRLADDLERISHQIHAHPDYCLELLRRFQDVAEGAALAAGCTAKVTPDPIVHDPLKPNAAMAALFRKNLERIDFPEDPDDSEAGYASTDCGNVSQAMPTIHPYIRICPDGVPGHSREMAEWSRSPLARTGMVAAAKALAMTALDLLAQPEELTRAKAEFARP